MNICQLCFVLGVYLIVVDNHFHLQPRHKMTSMTPVHLQPRHKGPSTASGDNRS